MSRVYLIAFRAMGCDVTIQLETEADGHALLGAVPAQVEAMEARLSRFRSESELSLFNAQAGSWVKVSPMLLENIRAAKRAALLTDGLFNPLILPALIANGYDRSFTEISKPVSGQAVPAESWRAIEIHATRQEVRIPANSALDLGGVAKGWAAARLAENLTPYGACLVNMGGDMVARGAPQGLTGWKVDIEDPFADSYSVASVWLRDASLVTSGIDFRRWTTVNGQKQHHIIDPRTGRAATTDVMAVTVQHRDAPTAEAFAKAVLLRGAENGLKWLQTQWNATGLVVRQDGTVMATPNFISFVSEGA